MAIDYEKLLNSARLIYMCLITNYKLVEDTEIRDGKNMDDFPALKKAAIGVTRAAQKLEIRAGDLTEQEAIDFSITLEKMLGRFPEAKV
jgi:hypothetical protein